MSVDDYIEKDISDIEYIKKYLESLKYHNKELVLTSGGEPVGAILTTEQYQWFLDQLDAQQDTSFIDERINGRKRTQSLDDFKKEFDQ